MQLPPEIVRRLEELEMLAQTGYPSIYVVIHLLRASLENNTHHQFAQHCAKATPVKQVRNSVETEPDWPDEV